MSITKVEYSISRGWSFYPANSLTEHKDDLITLLSDAIESIKSGDISHVPAITKRKAPTTIKSEDVINLYNEFIESREWPITPTRCFSCGPDLRKLINKASQHIGSLENWKIMFEGWYSHPFYSGKSPGFRGQPNIRMILRSGAFEELYDRGLGLQHGHRPEDADSKREAAIKALDLLSSQTTTIPNLKEAIKGFKNDR